MEKKTTDKKQEELKVSTLTALEKVRQGEIVQLPGWNEDEPFVARLRRVSLMGLLRRGASVIPNDLVAAAQKLYEGNASKSNATFEETARVYNIVIAEALVEPSLKTLEDAGIDLTEAQRDEIYLYALRGTKALETFRLQRYGAGAGDAVDDLQKSAK